MKYKAGVFIPVFLFTLEKARYRILCMKKGIPTKEAALDGNHI